MLCVVSRPSGITLVKLHSLQVTIKTNLLAEGGISMFFGDKLLEISVGLIELLAMLEECPSFGECFMFMSDQR